MGAIQCEITFQVQVLVIGFLVCSTYFDNNSLSTYL